MLLYLVILSSFRSLPSCISPFVKAIFLAVYDFLFILYSCACESEWNIDMKTTSLVSDTDANVDIWMQGTQWYWDLQAEFGR